MHITKLLFHSVGSWADTEPRLLHPRLTVFLGDNEAGKSTLRRAIEALLFGPDKDLAAPLPDHAFHAEAWATFDDGTNLQWTRSGKGIQPAEAAKELTARLTPQLQKRFSELNRLGTSDVRGNEKNFLNQSGPAGSLLFAASTGLSPDRIYQLEQNLETECKAHLKDFGTHGKSLKEVLGRLNNHNRTRQLDEVVKAMLTAQSVRDQCAQQLKTREDTVTQLRRFIKGLPAWEKHQEAEAAFEALKLEGAVPDAAWCTRVQPTYTKTVEQRSRFASAEEKLRVATEEAARLPGASGLTNLDNEIDWIPGGISSAENAHAEIEKEKGKAHTKRNEIRLILSGFGIDDVDGGGGGDDPLMINRADQLLCPLPTTDSLSKQLDKLAGLQTESKNIARELDECRRQLANEEAAQSKLPQQPSSNLVQAAHELEDFAKAEADGDAMKVSAVDLEAEVQSAMADLGLAHVVRSTLTSTVVVNDEAVMQQWAKLESARVARADIQQKCHAASATVDKQRTLLSEQELLLGDAPTLEKLAEARRRRDQAVAELRAGWAEGHRHDATELTRRAGVVVDAIVNADQLADRRFEAAAALTKVEETRRTLQENVTDLSKCEERLAKEAAAHAAVQLAYEALWSFCQPPPPSPRDWLDKWKKLVTTTVVKADRAAKLLHGAVEKFEVQRQDIWTRFRGDIVGIENLLTASALRRSVDHEVSLRKKIIEDSVKAQLRVEALRDQNSKQESKHQHTNAELAAWEAAWAAAWESEWAQTAPHLRQRFEKNHDLARHWLNQQPTLRGQCNELRALEQSLQKRLGQLDDFAVKVEAVIARASTLVPDLSIPAGLKPEDKAQWLFKETESARVRQKSLAAADKVKSDCAKVVESECRRLSDLTAVLEREWTEGGFPGPGTEQLVHEALKRSFVADPLRQKMKEALAAMGFHWPEGRESALTCIDQRSTEELNRDLADAERSVSTAKKEDEHARSELQERGNARDKMKAEVDDDGDAQLKETLKAAMLNHWQALANARVAFWLLGKAKARAIENSPGLLKRASENLETLTGGAYVGLQIGGGKETLIVKTAQQKLLKTAELSDGTHDQVWLALRLAVIAEQAHLSTLRLPVILDDALVQFDDSRTTAAFTLLKKLSEQVQIIVMTHHDHVVHLLQQVMQPNEYSLVMLTRPECTEPRTLSPQRPDIPRPAASKGYLPPDGDGDDNDDDNLDLACDSIKAFLSKQTAPVSMTALLAGVTGDGAEVDKKMYIAAMERLRAENRVRAEGKGKGTKYALVGD